MTAARSHVDPTDLDAVRAAVGLDRPGSGLQPIGMDRIVVGADALNGLAALVAEVRGPGPIAVVVDLQPMRRAGADLKSGVVELLRAVEPDVRLVALGRADEELHADAGAIEAAVAGARGSGVVVAVGSGTICDIAKEASRKLGVPEVVVQTANSVNAFSDDMAVLLIHGVKRTV
ncbi:MAG: iron-containing alcohol dehydrogenase, partial [Candidatus Limnocylindrales bacterium]